MTSSLSKQVAWGLTYFSVMVTALCTPVSLPALVLKPTWHGLLRCVLYEKVIGEYSAVMLL
jgi:hypothetical protein